VSTLVVKIVVVGTEWIVGGPYPKTFVEAVVVEVERTNEELLRDESAIELLLINDRFGGTLTFVGEAIPKQEHALDSCDAGHTEMELGKVCLLLKISRQRRLATEG
jgi:hypothetical protein